MADLKRIVNTKFWQDEKVLDTYSVEDKYFLLYLMTNPRSTQLGIYKLPKKIIGFETGYSVDVVNVLIERFVNKYENISYNHTTQEIALLNSLKYSIVKGGKPVSDLLIKELNAVEDEDLILDTYDHMVDFWNKSRRDFDRTVKDLFDKELTKRKVPKENNDNDNDNDNEDSYHDSSNDSYHDSSNDSYHDSSKPVKKSYGELDNVKLKEEEYNKLKELYPDDYEDRINKLSFYIDSKGKKYKSHYATIRSWASRDKEKTSKGNKKEIVNLNDI